MFHNVAGWCFTCSSINRVLHLVNLRRSGVVLLSMISIVVYVISVLRVSLSHRAFYCMWPFRFVVSPSGLFLRVSENAAAVCSVKLNAHWHAAHMSTLCQSAYYSATAVVRCVTTSSCYRVYNCYSLDRFSQSAGSGTALHCADKYGWMPLPRH